MYCPRCGTQNEDIAKFCKSCGHSFAAGDAGAETLPTELSDVDLVRHDLRDEYEIVEELGRGGMAIVFRAKEKQLDREVAIKVLPASLAFDREFVERFQREARTSAKLEHPNIIPIYRVGRTGRTIYFVMKFLRGKPLSSVINSRGALPPAEIRDFFGDICRALAYAHRSSVVHRDIKPDNIMFDEHGSAVVTDFGIAKAASVGRLTGTGMAIGTPHYMSPEQAKAQALDGRSDIYSLGVVGYVCLTGGVPFDGEDSFTIGYKHIMEPIPEPSLVTAEQRELYQVVSKMMAKSPDDRFQTAEEVLAALEGAPVLSRSGTGGIPLSPAARLSSRPTTPLPKITSAGLRAPTAAEERRAEARRSAAGGFGLFITILLVLVGGGGFWAYRHGLLPGFGPARPDSAAVAGGTTDSARLADSALFAGADTSAAAHPDSAKAPPTTTTGDTTRPAVPPGTPGRLTLRNVPRGARITVNGQPVAGTSLELPPGTHRVAVQATGGQPYEQQVTILAGGTHTVDVPRSAAGPPVDPCGEPGPAYNQGNVCWDTRANPLSAPFIPVDSNATRTPRPAILYIKVSRDGTPLDTRVVVPSDVATFTTQALDLARQLRFNPAQKNGEPVESWVQVQFQPVRQ